MSCSETSEQEESAFGQKGENVDKSMTTFQEDPNINKSLLETKPSSEAPPHVNFIWPWKQGCLMTTSLLRYFQNIYFYLLR